MSTIKKHYQQVFHFIKGRVTGLFWVSLFCFLGLILLVYFLSSGNTDFVTQMVGELMSSFESKGVYNENQHISCINLFFSNAVAAGSAIGWGIIPFLFLSVPMLAVNAIAIGIVASFGMMNGMSVITFLAGIVPHGIFEIPALMLSVALGINLCLQGTIRLVKKDSGIIFSQVILDTLKTYIMVVLPLLAAAAIIENYITVYIIQLFL